MSAPNNRDTICQQYRTDKDLLIRQAIHDKYTVPQVDYFGWVLDSIEWRGGERVLDVGSAVGVYHAPLMAINPQAEYIALDLSMGMLGKNPASRRLQADALHLPFPDNHFDVVMANHMLYHLPDIEAALATFKRVLKPDGVLLVATNSVQTMPELQVLMRRAILLLARTGSTQIQPPVPASDSFALENGTRQLARHFYAVMRRDLPGKLVLTESQPILDYIGSTRLLREPQLPDGVSWDDVMTIMSQQVDHLISHLGELVINKLTGVLVATDDGDFIQPFQQIKADAMA
ncbi:MAG: methyltransferase domain-containing protein [Anaerolineaceae bacterium]|nr:MAG: methyltransferase domain-containing protein [Anaerolineaceae bacterium]